MDQLHRRRSPGPTGARRRIYQWLRGQMADGTLAVGALLPSTRTLAAEYGVSRSTITAVYEQLAAEGFITTAPGKAARVAASMATGRPASRPCAPLHPMPLSSWGRRVADIAVPALPCADPVRYDFLYGAVASEDFPRLAWRRAFQTALLRQQPHLSYAPAQGDLALRQALQGYLRRARGIACNAGQILIVHGSQQAIDLCARLLLDAGDAFVFENPGYRMARHCFEATGARLLATPVDTHGLDTTYLPEDGSARLAYVTPSHQFPLGGVLPMGRRLELLQWAQRQSAWIIEDDYDSEFRYGQPPMDALHAIDPDDRVIYVGTFSKTLSPQLRLGYLVLPHALTSVFQQAKHLADRHAPVLEQQALAALIDSGAYERHVRRMRRSHERRQAALLQAIARHLPEAAQVQGTAAGLHIVLWLPWLSVQQEAELVIAARRKGLGVYPIAPLFAPSAPHARPTFAGLVLGYASMDMAQIQQAIAILAAVIAP